jgi:hypothetical protein
MITGFNTNLRHGGRVFHVQTEDSGRNHPHVISHLYHGGTILASRKRDYRELLDSKDLEGVVRRLMEEQHKKMLRGLRSGEFDPVIAQRLDAAVSSGSPTAPSVEEGAVAAAEAPAADDAREAGVTPEKPLDEVILEYLVEKARGRAAGGGSRTRE